jgi:hypothetical protein
MATKPRIFLTDKAYSDLHKHGLTYNKIDNDDLYYVPETKTHIKMD